MRKLMLTVVSMAALGLWAADDHTVPYGDTLNVSADTTYANLVVNGTLNVAEGVKLTCDTFILGDNLDHSQEKVARMTVASNATVTVNNSEKLSGGSYISTGYCKIGVNSRAELTLEGGSTFEAGGRMIFASGCTGTVDKVVYVKINVNDATLKAVGPLQFQGSRTSEQAVENAVVALNGVQSSANCAFVRVTNNKNSARIKFNGGKIVCHGWWSWGQQSVFETSKNAENSQRIWLESVNGNPIWLQSEGGDNTHAFFYAANPYPYNGSGRIYLVGTGELVLQSPLSTAVPICWTGCLQNNIDPGQISGLRILGKVSLGNTESVTFATNMLKNVKLTLPAGATFDVCATSFAIGELDSAGTIVTTEDTEATLTAGGTGDVVLSSPTLGAGVKLVKVGAGKLRVPSGSVGDIDVREGTFDFGDRKAVGFPYYRFWVYGKSKGGGDSGGHCGTVKLSEIEFYNNGTSVRDKATHTSYSRYGSNDTSPANAFNTVSNSEWRSYWYSETSERASNSVFFVTHFGGAGKFDFVKRAEFGSSTTPTYEAIPGAPVIGSINGIVTSYKYRLGSTQWWGYTNPEYFRLQGGIGDDEWVDLEDWAARGRYTKLGSGDSYMWSDEFPLVYPTNEVSVARLDLADGVEWTLDVAQTDLTVGNLNIAGSGTLRLENYGTVKTGKSLPVRFTSISGDQNLWHWTVYVDGVQIQHRIGAEDGQLKFIREGTIVIFR